MIESVFVRVLGDDTGIFGEQLIKLRSPYASGFNIRDIDGLGPVDSDLNMPERSLDWGARVYGSRNRSRTIGFDIDFCDPIPGADVGAIRRRLYSLFPTGRQVGLTFTDETNFSSYTFGYVESHTPNIFKERANTNISVRCPDPYFYSGREITTVLTSASSGEEKPSFEFPYSNESLTADLTQFTKSSVPSESSGMTIYYRGTAPAYAKVLVSGGGSVASNVEIRNTRNNTGFALKWNITSSVASDGRQRTREFTLPSFLDTNKPFSWVYLLPGTNTFKVSSTNGANVYASVTYTNAYLGV